MAIQLRSQLCTFENSTNCNEISFDPHSFSEKLKGLLTTRKIKDYQSIVPSSEHLIGAIISSSATGRF